MNRVLKIGLIVMLLVVLVTGYSGCGKKKQTTITTGSSAPALCWPKTEIDAFATGSMTVGQSPSIAVGSDNLPRITYLDRVNNDLKYGWYNGTTWAKGPVDQTGEVGKGSSLALNAANLPRIAYYRYDTGNRQLKYAAYDGSNWAVEDVTPIGDPQEGVTSLKLHPTTGRPYISFYNSALDAIMFTYHNGTSWQILMVDSESYWTGQYSSLCFQPDDPNRIGIAYYYAGNILKYASSTDGGAILTTEEVVTQTSKAPLALVFDTLNRPVILYQRDDDPSNEDLMLARKESGTWKTYVLEEGGTDWGTGDDISVALKPGVPAGQVWVTYYNFDVGVWRNGAVYIGTLTTPGISNKQLVVDPDGWLGGDCSSTAVGSDGKVWVAYWELTDINSTTGFKLWCATNQ